MPELEGEAIPQRLDIEIVRALDVSTQLRATPADAVGQDTSPGTLVGDFSVFGEWYEINSFWEGHFLERIAVGSFKRTINNRSGQSPVRVLLEHGFDPTVGDKPLGVPSVLEERGTGVYAETPLLDTSYNRDLAPALRAGAYGQSFRFSVMRDEWVETDSEAWEDPGNPAWVDLPQRTISEVRLAEFGPTVWPASPATNASTGLRSGTDSFYDALARRDSAAYDAAIRSVRGLRAPASAATPDQGPAADETQRNNTEDPQERHSETPAPEARHVEDSSSRHSEEPANTNHSQEGTIMAERLSMEERAARITEIDARLTEIDSENAGAALRTEDQAEWDALRNERTEHAEAIQAQEARSEQLRAAAAQPGAREGEGGREQRAQAVRSGSPSLIIKPENIYDTAAIRGRANGLDEARRLYTDHAKRAIEVAAFPGVEDRSAAQAHVSDLLEKLDGDDSAMALRLLRTGSPVYDRAFGKAVLAGNSQGLTTEEQRALSLGVDGSGGYAVPFQLDPTVILTSDGAINPLRQVSRVVQITGKTWEGLTSAGVTVSRKAEAAESGDNSPAFAQPSVATSRVDGFIPFSYELEYTWAQLRQELTGLLSDAKDMEEADSFVNGNGTAPEPQGVLTGATTTVLTASGTALTRADLDKVVAALPPRFRARASWLASVQFYSAQRELYAGLYNPLPITVNGSRAVVEYPFYESSAMPAYAETINTVGAIFGDFKQFVIVDRVGMNVELIPQVFGANQRPTGQRGIYAIWMNGSKVLVPGAFRVLKQAAA